MPLIFGSKENLRQFNDSSDSFQAINVYEV